MSALSDLWHSEKGIVGIILIVAVTILAALSKVTVDQWTDYTKWIFGIYVAGKTVQGIAATTSTKKNETTATVAVTETERS